MRSLKITLFLIFFFTATFVFSDDFKVRVVVSQANIRLKPDTQSAILLRIPLGGILDVIKKEGNWYYVKLSPDEKGIVVTGYIHQSIVEVIEEIESSVRPEKKAEPQRKEERYLKFIQKPVEQAKDLSTDSDYLKWKEDYYKAELDFKKWKKHAYIGQAGFGAGMLINLLTSTTTGVIIGSSVALGGVGLWLYAANKKGSAAEKMELFMNEGRIKKYFSAHINPRTDYYAITFSIVF